MNCYVAKIVFQITTGAVSPVAQFDEHLRLIYADSFEQAFLKARLIGIREEDSAAVGQQAARWEFVNILELYPLENLADGIELYSRVHETPEARAYINLVHRKASELAA